jgi:hypothetical protein
MSDCVSWFRNPFSSGLTQAERDCLTREGKASIESVVTNTNSNYPDQTQAERDRLRDFANQQEGQVGKDTDALNKGACTGLDLNGLGLGCYNSLEEFFSTISTLAKVGLVLLTVGAIGYVYVVFIVPFANRRR